MRSPPLANSFWIEPGRLLAGEYPGDADGASADAKLGALVRAGISYFIDLTHTGELSPYDHRLPPARADDGRYIIYVRMAIRDHGVPRSPEAMAEILDYIDRAIEVGHRVYVHCRAGIGRTNTVIGCWLRREGLSGPEAVERLNELWRTNARSKSWPHVPETAEQERYVLEWLEPADEAEIDLDLDATRTLRARYLGTLLGLACGDAMGSTLQFRKPGQFAPIADLLGGGHWQLPRGAWTDETAMALCLAESLLATDAFDAADQRRRYRRWQQGGEFSSTGACIGITATVASVLQQDAPPPEAGPRAETAVADIQAITRVGVVALFAVSAPARALGWAADAAAVTDPSPAMRKACRYFAALLLAALRGSSRESLARDACALLEDHGEPCERSRFDRWIADGQSGDVAGFAEARAPLAALHRTLITLLGTSGFREGLLQTVNSGGDSDVQGALFGQLAGAIYGVQGIPTPWNRALLQRSLLEDVADRLLVAGLAPRD
jgi:ADP-ribosylglycohydrolase/protein-tyrosine phosphatase